MQRALAERTRPLNVVLRLANPKVIRLGALMTSGSPVGSVVVAVLVVVEVVEPTHRLSTRSVLSSSVPPERVSLSQSPPSVTEPLSLYESSSSKSFQTQI